MALPPPSIPFTGWPLQVVDERAGFYAWYTRPAAIVFHGKVSALRGYTMERVLALVDVVGSAERADIHANGGLLVFHDWRAVTSIELDTRALLRTRFTRGASRKDVRGVYAAFQSTPIVRAVFDAVNMVARMATGISIGYVSDVGAEVRRLGIEPPSATRPPGFLRALR